MTDKDPSIYRYVNVLKLTYMYMYNKTVFMFTHAKETNFIITFINYSINVALTKVTFWNFTNIFAANKILHYVLIITESHFACY